MDGFQVLTLPLISCMILIILLKLHFSVSSYVKCAKALYSFMSHINVFKVLIIMPVI